MPTAYVCTEEDMKEIVYTAGHSEVCACDTCWKARYRHMVMRLCDAGGLESLVLEAQELLSSDPDVE